jgi:hypothetical protein
MKSNKTTNKRPSSNTNSGSSKRPREIEAREREGEADVNKRTEVVEGMYTFYFI